MNVFLSVSKMYLSVIVLYTQSITIFLYKSVWPKKSTIRKILFICQLYPKKKVNTKVAHSSLSRLDALSQFSSELNGMMASN